MYDNMNMVKGNPMKSWQKLFILGVLLVSSQVIASPFGNWGGNKWGKNSWGGNSFGSGCNDWPEWTPMYWMEIMIGTDDCDEYKAKYYSGLRTPYSGYPASNYNQAYLNPYNPYGQQHQPGTAIPYTSPYGYQHYQKRYYPMNNRGQLSRYSSFPMFGQGRSPFSNKGRGFPAMGSFGSGFNPMGGGLGSPMGAMSPMGFGSPMSPMGFGSPMSPMGFGSPMSPMGFGSPMSPMGFGSPMSPMGFGSPMSSMNPLGGGFGGASPLGMNPFSSGMRSPFSF